MRSGAGYCDLAPESVNETRARSREFSAIGPEYPLIPEEAAEAKRIEDRRAVGSRICDEECG